MIDPNAGLSLVSAIVSAIVGYLTGWKTKVGMLAILAAILSAGAAAWSLTHPAAASWLYGTGS